MLFTRIKYSYEHPINAYCRAGSVECLNGIHTVDIVPTIHIAEDVSTTMPIFYNIREIYLIKGTLKFRLLLDCLPLNYM